MRQITYITGTRADFGLMRRTLQAIDAHPDLALGLVVTGMHLSDRYGRTIDEIVASHLDVEAYVSVDVDHDDAGAMAIAAGTFSAAIARHFAHQRPDAVLLLGDRWEMLGAAMAATLHNIPIVHVCGGERSGTVDDAMRHAISRLAHFHFVATADAALRLIRSGEEENRIHVVGSPGLAGIRDDATANRDTLAATFGFGVDQPLAVILFHPVVQDADIAATQINELLVGVRSASPDIQALCLLPNCDAGNEDIRASILAFCEQSDGFRHATHVSRGDYLSLLSCADVLVGNSSSGIIESASFGIPTINVGDRQLGRERNTNIVDVAVEARAITEAVTRALATPSGSIENVYGDGKTDHRIVELLMTIPLDRFTLKKQMTF